MPELGEIADKVRSKNAGPFWLTIDVFCGCPQRFAHIVEHLDNRDIARGLGANLQELKRFDIPELNVIKVSVPRPTVQGTAKDRDMHGAQWANVLAEMKLPSLEDG